ncbi:uncharacterized protein ACA1_028150 [Acanthamoeba castellanii str. Neff]|uniref:Uncharacterized protein n=1 Tax=Acanthamoeba castellanii (strain ATCC 30010 / Neff) TaxID=1257118 RepID=L8GJZ9_ACACF|nr:uncharacterized protein ACA1_028150 [Acanthamoeba castellanii str. Neff]ELR12511.1 hypothetical protein ACA1_028150 [Acanthamoeba castellanii str. Neff]
MVLQFNLPDDDFYKFLVGAWKRNLEWREFGGTYAHVRTSNTVVLIEEYQRLDTTPAKNNDVYLEWQYSGDTCHGQFMDKTSVAILNFFIRSSTVTATYRIMDADTIAVCITEVDERHKPTIQYGNMYRIDTKLYAPDAPSQQQPS